MKKERDREREWAIIVGLLPSTINFIEAWKIKLNWYNFKDMTVQLAKHKTFVLDWSPRHPSYIILDIISKHKSAYKEEHQERLLIYISNFLIIIICCVYDLIGIKIPTEVARNALKYNFNIKKYILFTPV